MKHLAQFFAVLTAASALSLATKAQVNCLLDLNSVTLPADADAKVHAKLIVEIAPSWHIASITQQSGGPFPTEIAIPSGQPFRLAGKIIGPKAHKKNNPAFGMDVEMHTGTVIFTLPLVATTDIQPGTKLTVEITYQACNGETCLLQKTEKVTASIKPNAAQEESKKP